MNSSQRMNRMSPLSEVMVFGEQRAGVGGVLVNDVNGLCLVSKGNMCKTASTTTSNLISSDKNSGVYTSLMRLASNLTLCQTASMNNENLPSPLITIEMDGPTSIIVKEYDGCTIAVKLPNKATKLNDRVGSI